MPARFALLMLEKTVLILLGAGVPVSPLPPVTSPSTALPVVTRLSAG